MKVKSLGVEGGARIGNIRTDALTDCAMRSLKSLVSLDVSYRTVIVLKVSSAETSSTESGLSKN